MRTKLAFGTVVAFILLGFYVYAVYVAVRVAQCLSRTGCTTYNRDSITGGITLVLTLVGGLISALVIAELAVTKPGEAPAARMIQAAAPTTAKVVKVVATIYIIAWLAVGVFAFVVGVMQHDGVVQQLTDLGKSWIGLVVAAAYSYFGVQPGKG